MYYDLNCSKKVKELTSVFADFNDVSIKTGVPDVLRLAPKNGD